MGFPEKRKIGLFTAEIQAIYNKEKRTKDKKKKK